MENNRMVDGAGMDSTQFLLIAFQAILENTSSMVFVKDSRLIYRAVSPSFVRMTGKQSADGILGKSDFEVFDDEELARRYVADDRLLLASGNDRVDFIEPLTDEYGQPRYGSTSKYVLKDAEGHPVGIVGISRDITLEYLANQNHQRELEYLFELPEDTYFAVFIDINAWRIITERRQTIGKYSFPPHETIESLLQRAYVHIMDRKETAYIFYRCFSRETLRSVYADGKREIVMEYRRRMTDGTLRWVRDELKFMIDPSNSHLCVMLIVRDIQEKKEKEENLIRAAERDELTGLLNRAAVQRQVQNLLERSAPDEATVHALFMIDADNFKQVNDTCGHQEGDRFLVRFGQAIRRCFRETDVVGRIGGDEFLVMMRDVPSEEIVRKKANLLLEAMKQVFDPQKLPDVSGSIGVSLYREDGVTFEELYRRADEALYRAKRAGKNRVFFASDEE